MAFINCSECDATISDKAIACPHCGAPVANSQNAQEPAAEQVHSKKQHSQESQHGYAETTNYAERIKDTPPKTWLLESILATLFCCLPFGIVGIVYAAKVESSWYGGDRQRSLAASRTARTWTIISICVGLAGILVYLICLALGVATATFRGFWT